jgi:hypothetical protein
MTTHVYATTQIHRHEDLKVKLILSTVVIRRRTECYSTDPSMRLISTGLTTKQCDQLESLVHMSSHLQKAPRCIPDKFHSQSPRAVRPLFMPRTVRAL